jgi:diaminohydroxyphosphoribosylaminopyrimidine deaminase/5-amino-6-(5-phosphoribosylamino)uracil reductase
MNNAFAFSIVKNRPFVTLKAALSVDGMLAPPVSARKENEPFWLTGPAAREEVQRLRHASDAILTGIGTVLADDPLLTDRTGLPRRRPLMRVVLDTDLRIPLSAKLVQTAQEDVWIFCGPQARNERRKALEALGVRVTAVDDFDGLKLSAVLAHLHSEKLNSVLVESGSALNGAFLRLDAVDQAILFYAETELGPEALPFAEGSAGPFALEQKMVAVRKRSFAPDVCVSGLLHDPWPKSNDID